MSADRNGVTVGKFRGYRRQAEAFAREILSQCQPGEFDEQALPAYTHRNRLMRWLFWQRLRKVSRYLGRTLRPGARVLDFGCGIGMLMPLLAARGFRLSGVDLDVRNTGRFLARFGVTDAAILHADQLDSLPPGQFDAVTALDVLEHVPDLEGTVGRLGRLLRPGGRLVVCGPTENILYKLGRRLAGFSGHYHVRNIADIHTVVRQQFTTAALGTLYPGMPLFRLFAATRRSAAA